MTNSKQSFKGSVYEQIANIGSGFILSCLVWEFIVNPAITRGYLTIEDTIYITTIFTITSFLRSLLWRRIFNHVQ